MTNPKTPPTETGTAGPTTPPVTTPAQAEKAVAAEEAALTAEVSAAHADKAAEQAATDAAAAEKAASKNTPPCPHCGKLLKSHNDTEGSMHCYSAACGGASSACCFTPAPEGPRGRAGASHPG